MPITNPITEKQFQEMIAIISLANRHAKITLRNIENPDEWLGAIGAALSRAFDEFQHNGKTIDEFDQILAAVVYQRYINS